MADRITKRSSSKTDAREIARAALSLGLSPVPLKPKSKRPAGGEGWNQFVATPENIDDYFQSEQNVGILWGKPSDWVVDIDLDCEEAILVARRLLPETYVYGRQNRPASHVLFRSRNCPTKKWYDNDGSVMIEVRSTGSQSVWVGSTHPDGDRYIVNDPHPWVEIDQDELFRRLGQAAAIILLARAYPSGGTGRHDFVHALAGALTRDGYEPAIIRELIIIVLDLAQDRESDPEQRVRTIDNTIKRAAEGGHTHGWATLGEWIDDQAISRIRGYLKGTQLKTAPEIVIRDSRKERPAAKPEPDLKIPEGLVAEIAAWSASRAYVVGAKFDLAAALMCTALASGNRYVMQSWDTPLQPYLMVLAPTGGGKDSTHRTVYDFARRFDLRDHVFQGFQSFHALLDSLAAEPSIACWLWDEAARKLRSAGKASGSQDYQILTHLLQMYGKSASGVAGLPGRGHTIAAIDRPYLITMATAQPAQMIEAITTADLATGLLARFLLLDCGDETPPLHHERLEIFPSRIEKYVRSFRDVVLGEGGFVTVRFAENAIWARFKDFANSVRKATGEEAELWNRAAQNALIVAGLLAVGRDVQKPVVDHEICEFSIELSSRSVAAWIRRLSSTMRGRDRNEQLTRRVEELVANPLTSIGRARPSRPKEKALMARGFLPRAVLLRLVRFDRRRDIDDVLKILLEGEVISEGTKEGCHVYWSS
jgi:hypothetical protein